MEKLKLTKPTKSQILKLIIFILFVAVTIVSYVFANEIRGEDSVFNRNVSDNNFVQALYSRGVPGIVITIRVITITAAISLVLRFITRKSFAHTARGITITKLLESFIKWVIAIVSILLVLGAWGVDTSTLLASAGILTLVIGLGAQSLVADIVAGIFIVFEGSIEVGDIVIVNGWRGTVQEIGIRTTKVADAGGNLNIINNSEITTIINQTKANSLAKIVVGIEYGESLGRVEKILTDHLPDIATRIPTIIDGPTYKGVDALNTSSVDLLIVATCKEEDIFQVQRDLNREIKLLFDAEGISIAYPQIVVHRAELSSDETKTEAE